MEQELYRIHEFCQRYGIARATFYREVNLGRLHPLKFDNFTLVPGWEAERWNRNRWRTYKRKNRGFVFVLRPCKIFLLGKLFTRRK